MERESSSSQGKASGHFSHSSGTKRRRKKCGYVFVGSGSPVPEEVRGRLEQHNRAKRCSMSSMATRLRQDIPNRTRLDEQRQAADRRSEQRRKEPRKRNKVASKGAGGASSGKDEDAQGDKKKRAAPAGFVGIGSTRRGKTKQPPRDSPSETPGRRMLAALLRAAHMIANVAGASKWSRWSEPDGSTLFETHGLPNFPARCAATGILSGAGTPARLVYGMAPAIAGLSTCGKG